jgi:hypothetical protein
LEEKGINSESLFMQAGERERGGGEWRERKGEREKEI